MNRSYSLNSVCPKFISNLRVFRKIGVRKFEVLMYLLLLVSDLESARGTIVPTLADMLCEACREAGDIDCIKRHCLPEGNAS